MAEWLSLQLQLAGAAFLAGLLLGLLYCIYEAAQQRKGRRHHRRFWRGDVLFSLLAAALLLLFWFSATDGSFSLAAVMMLWGGFLLFRLLLAPRLTFIWRRSGKNRAAAVRTARSTAADRRTGNAAKSRKAAEKVPPAQRWAESSVLCLLHGYDKQQQRRAEKKRLKEERRRQEQQQETLSADDLQ